MNDMSYFAPRELHRSLQWIGRKDFFTLNLIDNFRHKWLLKPFPCEETDKQNHTSLLNHLFLANGDELSRLCITAKAIANGPKLFSPSLENCIVMENVDLQLPFDDYRQPFSPLFIQFPQAWRQRVIDRTGYDKCPEFVVCYRHENNGAVSLHTYFSRSEIVSSLAAPRPEFKYIENALTRSNPELAKTPADEMDFYLSRFFQRMAMNFCVLLTHVGTKNLGPLDPKQHERNAELVCQKRNRERGEMFQAGEIYRVGIDQNIRLYDVVERGEDDGEVSGISPHPHWRRGHWKQQAYGSNLSLRKRIFINPVFVCAHRFDGDLSSTSVNYRDSFKSSRVSGNLPEFYRKVQ